MCTDLRLVALPDIVVSARTLDFALELQSAIQVVPRGQQWSATDPAGAVPPLRWSNDLGFVAVDGFGFPDLFADGLNEAGLSVATLWLPETSLPATPPPGTPEQPAIDLLSLCGWLLGTCRSVAEARVALSGARVWNATPALLWPTGVPVPAAAQPLLDHPFTEHLALHDSSGASLVVEFLADGMHLYDNPTGVLTNSPPFAWHLVNLRNYLGLTNVEAEPMNLMGMPVRPTGNGSGLRGLPGDITPPSRFVRAVVLAAVNRDCRDRRDAANQAFHALDLVSVPRHLAASGDYTQWFVVRDHDGPTYHVRSYDGWSTTSLSLAELGITGTGARRKLPLPA